jgi:hypothetical protein
MSLVYLVLDNHFCIAVFGSRKRAEAYVQQYKEKYDYALQIKQEPIRF